MKILHLCCIGFVFAIACAHQAAPPNQTHTVDVPSPQAEEPMLKKWVGAYGGLPPFDNVDVSRLRPALELAMATQLDEIEVIANNTQAPTFENTIAALEDTGRSLNRVGTLYSVWRTSMASPEFQKVEQEVAPQLAAHGDAITQNVKLFRRVEAVFLSKEKESLTPEQQRLTWSTFTNFVHSGAKLEGAAKTRSAAINQRLALLYTQFGQNVLADEEHYAVVLESEADLAGLPESVRAGASAAAEGRGLKGKWVITNTRSSVEPFLSYSSRRDLRQKVFNYYINRGDNNDSRDNNNIIAEILELRGERARLLGYLTHAHWQLENSMAQTPERAMGLMNAVWPAAVARVHREVADMQKLADAEKAKFKIEPWDYRYYAEKVRKDKYDLDENEIKPYLQLEKLREGMFWVAGELFGFAFEPVSSVPVFHADVRVWEVKDKATGKHIGLWYFDPYARPGKRSGAWKSTYRSQERFRGEISTIVSNNSNFVKPSGEGPVLISWGDAETLFHEFGHALHGLASNVNYPLLSGTNVARDYVEFPSQLLEHWLSTPQVLNRFALHYQTGKPLSQDTLNKIQRAATFNQGFATVEYLASALVDMKLHLAVEKVDAAAFERETLAALKMPPQVVMRHRTPQFGHIFASDSYSASYYSYLWADTLTADAFEAFTEGKGPYDQAVASRLRKHIFTVGNTKDPAESYRAFRGADAGIEALMRKRGFPTTTSKRP